MPERLRYMHKPNFCLFTVLLARNFTQSLGEICILCKVKYEGIVFSRKHSYHLFVLIETCFLCFIIKIFVGDHYIVRCISYHL
uniref:Putative secreted protein n=1 Tax=Amblyomma triste TaxID=251400 RepID=A0A023G3N6_AMBTT